MRFESIFIFIIIAIVTSLLNKNKQKSVKKVNRIPVDTGEFRNSYEAPLTDMKGKKESIASAPKNDLRESEMKKGKKSEPKSESPYDKRISAEKDHSILFNQQSLVQGIIMSEVLGKPKSMRNR
jgi:hypothetical protein